MPDVTPVMTSALETSWVAGLLVLLVVSVFGFFGFVLRKILDSAQTREERLSTRVSALETEVRNELFAQLRLSSATMAQVIMASERMCLAADRVIASLDRFAVTLQSRPCLMTKEKIG